MNVFTLSNLIVLLTNIAVSVFVFSILARQAGLAMGNAWLYRELQRKVETLGRIVREWQDNQSKRIQTEKIASMGMMAASLTHEINNPLSAILVEAQLLLEDKGKDKEVAGALKTIVEQGKRIKVVTERLGLFARKRELNPAALDINEIVLESIALLTVQTKLDNIEIVKEMSAGSGKINGDRGQLQEVFLNIMLNAIEVMPKGGILKVKTYEAKVVPYEREKTRVSQDAVVIEFSDSGKGMDEETLNKIFDPFFTTKSHATGLGLSICQRIVESHNGIIEVKSKPGEGSTFIIKLPR